MLLVVIRYMHAHPSNLVAPHMVLVNQLVQVNIGAAVFVPVLVPLFSFLNDGYAGGRRREGAQVEADVCRRHPGHRSRHDGGGTPVD